MKLRSRGLGRKELVMDFRRYDIRRDGEEVLITGTITEPVTWDFSIRIQDDDIPGLIRVARSKAMVSLFFRWMGRVWKRGKATVEEVRDTRGLPASKGVSSTYARSAATRVSNAQSRPRRRADTAERRKKIAEARVGLQTSQKGRESDRGGARAAQRQWATLRVGAVPSGNGVSGEESQDGKLSPGSTTEVSGSRELSDRERERLAPTGGEWRVKRPGALPKLS